MPRIGRILASSMAATVVAGTAMASLLVAPAQAAETDPSSTVGIASSDDGACTTKKTVGNGRNKGDIFHSYAKTTVFKHNHVGIYYTTKTIVEAPGSGQKSRSVTASTLKKCGPIYKMYVDTKQANRDKAANHAYNNFRGLPYDSNFVDNKDNSNGKLNCSELVWKAYKHGAKIDLDSNGGEGVYPDNIKDHKSTVVYATIK
ncbi:YiiX/YebB-like N1pC/P60 family cysteine hydrolase [Lentzea sp. E54]|uniref:YiiX/YebB-like N1pC/P60 family cysteine hydrolase n=1 Tax=Lentzea xerophila TaxID=3435883 RepID=UPI003DA32579